MSSNGYMEELQKYASVAQARKVGQASRLPSKLFPPQAGRLRYILSKKFPGFPRKR